MLTALREIKATRAKLALRDLRARRVTPALRDLRDLRDLRERKVTPALRDLRVRKVRMVMHSLRALSSAKMAHTS